MFDPALHYILGVSKHSEEPVWEIDKKGVCELDEVDTDSKLKFDIALWVPLYVYPKIVGGEIVSVGFRIANRYRTFLEINASNTGKVYPLGTSGKFKVSLLNDKSILADTAVILPRQETVDFSGVKDTSRHIYSSIPIDKWPSLITTYDLLDFYTPRKDARTLTKNEYDILNKICEKHARSLDLRLYTPDGEVFDVNMLVHYHIIKKAFPSSLADIKKYCRIPDKELVTEGWDDNQFAKRIGTFDISKQVTQRIKT